MRVSVIVPVHNTGPAVAALVESLRAQTLPADQWEAVFVDDGSSDGTPALLERLIADAPNMRLIREAPSGWPGRPRNVGIDAALGDYVFFSDDDDTLGPEALQRLSAFAAAHDADVVVPRTAGRNRGVPSMPRTVIDAQEETALIMSSLAPQKLFRRAFLNEAGIRFREGRFRLEDHLFVVTAYLRARRVSTYADYPCYTLTYQPGRAHISQQQPDWHAYFASVRACLDVVDAECSSVEQRRAMRGRWLRAEALSRLRGDGYAKLGSLDLLREVRQLLLDRFDAGDLAALRPLDRLLAELLIDGRDDEVAALAAWESALQVTTELRSADIGRDGAIRIELRSTLRTEGRAPTVEDTTGRYPAEQDLLDQIAGRTRIGIELQHAATRLRRPLTVRHDADGVTIATGATPLDSGRWRVVAIAGEHRNRRRRPVRATAGRIPTADPARVSGTGAAFVLDGAGALALHVRRHERPNPVRWAARGLRRRLRLLATLRPALPVARHG